jgi:hypothetical protein
MIDPEGLVPVTTVEQTCRALADTTHRWLDGSIRLDSPKQPTWQQLAEATGEIYEQAIEHRAGR